MIIGFGYRKGTGKSTCGKFLSTYLRSNFPRLKITEISFASKLKDVAFQLWGWAGLKRAVYYETHYQDKEVILPLIGKSPRQVWIELGNKCREIYNSTWVDYALNGIKSDIIIITDMGFVNEALAIRAKGGKLIKLVRDGLPLGTDPREVELDSWTSWDYVVHNNRSLDDLYKEVVKIWEDCNE